MTWSHTWYVSRWRYHQINFLRKCPPESLWSTRINGFSSLTSITFALHNVLLHYYMIIHSRSWFRIRTNYIHSVNECSMNCPIYEFHVTSYYVVIIYQRTLILITSPVIYESLTTIIQHDHDHSATDDVHTTWDHVQNTIDDY